MLRALFCVLCLAWTLRAAAHTDEYFDQHPTPHGGQIRMAGPYHLELLIADQVVTLYVTDHADNGMPTDGGSAKAIVMTGKKRYVVILSPAGDNTLKGEGEFKLGKSSSVTVIVTLPQADAQQAHFTVKRKKTGSASTQHRHRQ